MKAGSLVPGKEYIYFLGDGRYYKLTYNMPYSSHYYRFVRSVGYNKVYTSLTKDKVEEGLKEISELTDLERKIIGV